MPGFMTPRRSRSRALRSTPGSRRRKVFMRTTIPIDGPVGELLRAFGRHNMRPAHLHFLVYKHGFKTLISQLYVPDDKHIETDVQYGVTRHLIGDYVRHDEPCPQASDVKPPWYSLEHTFVMESGEARLPKPPISGKARGVRPEIPHLEAAE